MPEYVVTAKYASDTIKFAVGATDLKDALAAGRQEAARIFDAPKTKLPSVSVQEIVPKGE